MPAEGTKITTKYIEPDERLIKYVNEKPLLDRRRSKLNVRMAELESKRSKHLKHLLSAKEEKELNDIAIQLKKIKSRSGTLSDDKTKLLDNVIFPAMASLSLFFEAVLTIPELSNFESDIRELLGIRRHRPRAFNYAFMFKQLMIGMIGVTGADDYKLKLVHELHNIIFRKVYGCKIVDSKRARNVVFEDIGRAVAWTEMLAFRIPDEYDLSKLQPRYEKVELDKCKTDAEKKKYMDKVDKKTLEDFETYTNKIIPSRSFDLAKFNVKKLVEQED